MSLPRSYGINAETAHASEPWVQLIIRAGYKLGEAPADARHMARHAAREIAVKDALVERLVEALEPFARMAGQYPESVYPGAEVGDKEVATPPRLRDLRRASEALRAVKGGGCG